MEIRQRLAPAPRRYRLVTELYLERFGDECLLLVADRDLLLTVNAAAARLFEALTANFSGRAFTVQECVDWLGQEYELSVAMCRQQCRELMAFGLKHHLVERAAPTAPVATAGAPL